MKILVHKRTNPPQLTYDTQGAFLHITTGDDVLTSKVRFRLYIQQLFFSLSHTCKGPSSSWINVHPVLYKFWLFSVVVVVFKSKIKVNDEKEDAGQRRAIDPWRASFSLSLRVSVIDQRALSSATVQLTPAAPLRSGTVRPNCKRNITTSMRALSNPFTKSLRQL